jgi:hypothetical protein
MVQQPFAALQSTVGRQSAEANGGLVAGRTGAVNDCVLLFAVAPTLVGVRDFFTAINDPDEGTSVTVRAPGWYALELYVEIVADDLVPTVGVSQDVAAAGLIQTPDYSIAGFLDVQSPVLDVLTVAGTTIGVKITSLAEVTDLQANQVIGGVEGSRFRFHGAIAEGSAPGAGLVQATPYYRVKRIGRAFTR